MINVDTRLLSKISESEFWLLCHIVRRLGDEGTCFPSNETLMKDTGWKIDKLRANKMLLQKRGYISVEERFNNNRQTSNFYRVKTKLMGVFVTAEQITKSGLKEGEGLEKPTGIKTGKTNGGEGLEKPTTEVLSREEVLNAELRSSASQKSLFEDKGNSSKKDSSSEPSNKVPKDRVYAEFVRLWCHQYPELGFDAMSGKKIKEMILKSRGIVREREEAGVANLDIPVDDRVIGVFQYILNYAARSNNWAHGKSISTFESKYREIYNEIINGTPKQKTGQRRSVHDFQEYIKSL